MLKAAYSFISFYHELLNATKLSVFFHIALPFVALKGHLCYLFILPHLWLIGKLQRASCPGCASSSFNGGPWGIGSGCWTSLQCCLTAAFQLLPYGEGKGLFIYSCDTRQLSGLKSFCNFSNKPVFAFLPPLLSLPGRAVRWLFPGLSEPVPAPLLLPPMAAFLAGCCAPFPVRGSSAAVKPNLAIFCSCQVKLPPLEALPGQEEFSACGRSTERVIALPGT